MRLQRGMAPIPQDDWHLFSRGRPKWHDDDGEWCTQVKSGDRSNGGINEQRGSKLSWHKAEQPQGDSISVIRSVAIRHKTTHSSRTNRTHLGVLRLQRIFMSPRVALASPEIITNVAQVKGKSGTGVARNLSGIASAEGHQSRPSFVTMLKAPQGIKNTHIQAGRNRDALKKHENSLGERDGDACSTLGAQRSRENMGASCDEPYGEKEKRSRIETWEGASRIPLMDRCGGTLGAELYRNWGQIKNDDTASFPVMMRAKRKVLRSWPCRNGRFRKRFNEAKGQSRSFYPRHSAQASDAELFLSLLTCGDGVKALSVQSRGSDAEPEQIPSPVSAKTGIGRAAKSADWITEDNRLNRVMINNEFHDSENGTGDNCAVRTKGPAFVFRDISPIEVKIEVLFGRRLIMITAQARPAPVDIRAGIALVQPAGAPPFGQLGASRIDGGSS
ncbi:hypothetical protein EI94DRAFT_1790139 [Lactarius quietus]|nr:hypothetical protein EI94DRAFT_1790139 [Lactarius quietus]